MDIEALTDGQLIRLAERIQAALGKRPLGRPWHRSCRKLLRPGSRTVAIRMRFAREPRRVNCTRNCTRKTGSIVRHEATNIIFYFLIVFHFFLFDGVLVGSLQHVVCGVSMRFMEYLSGTPTASIAEALTWRRSWKRKCGTPLFSQIRENPE